MKRLSILIFALTVTLASAAFAHEPTLARPLDADRELAQLDASAYSVTLLEGETLALSSNGVKRVNIDETRHVRAAAHKEGEQIVLTAGAPGKSVVRFHHADGTVTTFVVSVAAS